MITALLVLILVAVASTKMLLFMAFCVWFVSLFSDDDE